jgi:DNA-binding SARP family transcriptional activator
MEVRHDGVPADIRGHRPLELLALLVIRPNRPVNQSALVDELWDGAPVDTADNAFRIYLQRLRRALEPGLAKGEDSAHLVRRGPQLVLCVDPDQIDARRFERAVRAAADANLAAHPDRAIAQANEALDLWRGPPLAEGAHLPSVRAAVEHLEDLHALAIEELADARLARNEPHHVTDLLRDLAARDPARERPVTQLVTIYRRLGRPQDALEVARRHREALLERGITPNQDFVELERAVLLQAPAATRPVEPTRATDPRPASRRFVGRHTEYEHVMEGFEQVCAGATRAVFVTGAPGAGKTTLAAECAKAFSDRGARVLRGTCSEQATASYQPIVEILHGIGGLDVDALVAAPPATQTSTRDPESGRYLWFEGIASKLAEAVAAPRVLVVEDLQWADRQTLAALRHLLRHPALDGTYLVATVRDDEVPGARRDLV